MHQSSFHIMTRFHKLLLSHFKNKKVKILDVGSYGVNGTYKEIFSDESKFIYTGLDVNPGPNVDYVPDDPYVWEGLENESYDAIISGQAFEHIEFPWLIIKEMNKKLKKGGLICIVAPSRGPEHKYPVDCWRYYPDGFRALAKWAGLEVLETETHWGATGFSDGSDQWGDSFCILHKGSGGDEQRKNNENEDLVKRKINRFSPLDSVKGDSYYSFARDEVISLIKESSIPTGKVMEIGCAGGATGKRLKDSLPNDYYLGVEISEQAAILARQRLDKVIVTDIEKVSLSGEYEVKKKSFDLIIALDVLEHLYNPWDVLAELKGYLKPGGHVLASIPNVQNVSIVQDLIKGKWRYVDAGILDATHLRFFTLEEIKRMFEGADLKLQKVNHVLNPAIDVSTLQETGNIFEHENIKISDLSREAVHELFTYQYLIIAENSSKPSGKNNLIGKAQVDADTFQEQEIQGEPENTFGGPNIFGPKVIKKGAMHKGLVSIVILTFNQLEFTKQCVKSIQKQTPEPHEIIFVDNSSTDGSKKWLKKIIKENPNYLLVENRENLGFAKGCNQGIEKSSGEYILLLNNDVIVTENWLSGLLEGLNSEPDIGIVGPMTNNISGPQKVPGVDYKNAAQREEYAEKYRDKNRHRRVESRRIVGFCMLFRRELADKIGGLDESFGSGNFEDDDYCLRAALAGFRNFIVGDVFIHHFGSVTFIGNRIDYGSAMSGNRKIFDNKWSGIDIKSSLGSKVLLLNALEKADSLYQKDSFDAAVDVLSKIISHAPDDQRAYFFLAEILLNTKRDEKVLSVLDKMPEQHKDIKYKEFQAYCMERLNADKDAMVCADASLQGNPRSAIALNVKGRLAYKKGDIEAAEVFWEKAITADPSYGYSYTNMGLLRREQGKSQEAFDFFEKAAILSPLALEAVNNYLEAASGAGAFEEAEIFLKEAVSLHPVNKRLRYSYIDILLKQKKQDEAKQQTEEATTLFGPETDIGSWLMQSGDENLNWEREKVELTPFDNNITVSLSISVIGEFNVLENCITSFEKHTGVPFELILIVDALNKKNKERLKSISANALRLKIKKVKKGSSLGHRYNAGLEESRGEFFVFCHSDVVFANGWYDSFSQLVKSITSVGMVGPLFNDVSGLQRCKDASVVSVDQFDGLAQKIQDHYRYRRISINKLSSYCFMCHRALFENVGLFDEKFLMEDFMMEDFCRRISIAGKENFIAADVLLYHFDKHKNTLKGEKKTQAFKSDKMAYVEKWGTVKLDTPLGNRLLLLKSLDKARELEHEGEVEKAASQLLKTINHAPNDPAAYFALAALFFQAKQYDEALGVLSKFPKVNDPECIALVGYCKEGQGIIDEAEEYADKALSLNPESPQALNLKGVILYKNGNKDGSEEYFKKAIESDPGYGEPYTNIGLLKWEVSTDNLALNYLEKGFVLSPNIIDNATNYHTAITALGLFDRAEPFFSDAVVLSPHNKRLVFLYIDILIKLDKYMKAMHEIESAIVRFGVDDGLLAAALNVRDVLGPNEIVPGEQKRKTISLCIITKNEEKHIAKCLKSVSSSVDEMIVVDTGSKDRTKEIAKIFGAKVYETEWKEDFSEARNVSLSKANGDWVLVLDADEVVSTKDYELLHELVKKGSLKAYIVLTRNYVRGVAAEGWVANNGQYPKEETGAGWYPSEKVRLFQRDINVRFENPVHELVEPALARNGISFAKCNLVVHHYGRLDEKKVSDKGEKYYQLGIKKLKEQGGGLNAMHELAVQAGELGKYEEAIELWKKVLKLVPQDASRAFLNMGFAFMQLEKYEASILASKQALEIDPKLKEAALNYATCSVLIGEIQEVIVFLEEFLSKGEFYPSAMGILAAAYCINNQLEEGRRLFAKVRSLGFNIKPFIEFLIEKLDLMGNEEIADKLRNATLNFL